MGSIRALGLLGVVLLVQNVAATQFTVGGSSGWAVPSDNNAAYNQWAERMRFQIGDSLLFNYPSGSDSVLRVTKDDFDSCNTASPLEKHADGHTVFTFSQSGPHYFISGNKNNCQKNEKMVVVVLADRTKSSSSPAPAPSTASPPSPSTERSDTLTPSPAPTMATTDQTPPSPPPEAPSTPAPTQQATPSGASSVASWRVAVGSVGAFAGSVALLAAL